MGLGNSPAVAVSSSQPNVLPVAQPVSDSHSTNEGQPAAVPLTYDQRLEKVNHIGFIVVIVVSVLGVIGTLSSPVIGGAHLCYWGFQALQPAGLAYKEGRPIVWKEVAEKILALLPFIFVNLLGAFDLLSCGIIGWINIGLIGAHYLCKGVNVYAYLKLDALNYSSAQALQQSASIAMQPMINNAASAAVTAAVTAAANNNKLDIKDGKK